MWLAGGGINRGVTVGATDELGYNVTEDPIGVHDLQATILPPSWASTTPALTYRFQGRDFRLTDVEGNVVVEGWLRDICPRTLLPKTPHLWGRSPWSERDASSYSRARSRSSSGNESLSRATQT